MWNVKAKVLPVIIGATGTISKSLRQYLSNISGKHEVQELQKTAILGTAHIRRIVKVKVKNVKFTLEQATKAQRGNRGIALLFL